VIDEATLHQAMILALRNVFDPEIPVNIYELGLIYRLETKWNEASQRYDGEIDMTLTSPGCPVAGTMPGMVKEAVAPVEGLGDVVVNLVWDPPWDKSRMSDEAKLQLNMF
jgi:FeS assembly SUF system protein